MTKSEMILMRYYTMLMEKHSIREAESLLTPLEWYIGTARASMDFIRRLDAEDPEKVMAILEGDGSIQDVVDKLKSLLGLK